MPLLSAMEARVLQAARVAGPVSRTSLAEQLGVSKPTVSAAMETLAAGGYMVTIGRGPSSGGRRPALYDLNPRAAYVVGVDVGGMQVRVALADFRGDVVVVARERTEAEDARALADQITSMAWQLADGERIARARVVGACIDMPGVWDPVERVAHLAPNLPATSDRAFAARIARHMPIPVRFENDVNAAAIGEFRRGGGGGHSAVFIAMGTGFGAGLMLGGRVHDGAHGRAGEIGYFPAVRQQVLEQVLSGTGLGRAHREAGGSGDPHDALAEALQGEQPGSDVVSSFLDTLADVLSAVGLLLDPGRVLLGGGVGVALEAFLPDLRRRLAARMPFDIDVRLAELREDAALIGAVTLALDGVWDRIGASA